METLNKDQIKNLLPHRVPMLLIDELTEIKKLQDEINKQKNIISNDELKIKIDEYKNKISIFQKEKKQLIEDFNKQKQKQMNDFFNQVTPIISEYMEKNNVSIIFDKKIFLSLNQMSILQLKLLI